MWRQRAHKVSGPHRYTKRPVTILAWQVTKKDRDAIVRWVNDSNTGTTRVGEHAFIDRGDTLVIRSTADRMSAPIGSYVIKGIKGEFYPCPADIFEATYDKGNDEC